MVQFLDRGPLDTLTAGVRNQTANPPIRGQPSLLTEPRPCVMSVMSLSCHPPGPEQEADPEGSGVCHAFAAP